MRRSLPMAASPLFLIFLLTTVASISAAPASHFISQLPGFTGSLPSNHYSGYITVDEEHGRNLFYYFVISEGNPAVDPVVLWMNGGPGCSSFDGFVYENGENLWLQCQCPINSLKHCEFLTQIICTESLVPKCTNRYKTIMSAYRYQSVGMKTAMFQVASCW